MTEFDGAALERVRRQIDHPVLDADGHCVEFLPAVREQVAEVGGEHCAQALDAVFDAGRTARSLDDPTRRALGLFRMSWWAFPTRATLDRAAAMLPGLLNERLPEIGIDFAVLYPTLGLTAMHLDDAELRGAAARGFNRFYAEAYRPYAHRMTPAAVIPMHSPEEAIAELDYAVGELGFRVAVLAGHVQRPLPGDNTARAARWIDSFGPDDPTAYDAVWKRCGELGISPTFHSSGMGWGSRSSLSNYVFNHIGNFAAGGEAACRSLFLSGVPARFPELRFAFLEGGVGWAANLYADLIGHFEKRGAHAIGHLDPRALDRAQLAELFDRYADAAFKRNLDGLDEALRTLSDPDEDPAAIDEFRHAAIARPEDIREVFCERFFYGCEADDPLNALAFDTRANPLEARLRAIFSSDIGHWDVPDMRAVLIEAYELVDAGRLSPADFRAFAFENAAALFTATNPSFFAGTAVEAEIAALR